jgi:hypothetical protein
MASWYKNSREGFLRDDITTIVDALHKSAAEDRWQIEPDQDGEWRETLTILRNALSDESMGFITGVIAEYDFRRRGIRIDFILVSAGALYILEFKRGETTAADRDQVMNYCVNLVEFHERTQSAKPKLFPVLISRTGSRKTHFPAIEWQPDWPQICRNVAYAKAGDLRPTLSKLQQSLTTAGDAFTVEEWDAAAFNPSSTIIDAAISLYGQHEVSAMKEHAAPKADIDRCIASVIKEINAASDACRNEIIIVSGAPGAGKTLVGLAIAFHDKFRGEAVFVTGNAPLVKVLNGSLKKSYLELSRQGRTRPLGGYTRVGIHFAANNSDFKIVNANRFLEAARGRRAQGADANADGRILIFDEAQRTYSAGEIVNGRRLEDDEAVLITEEMARRPEAIIVLLVGHNQHIGTNEMGAKAWLNAARKHGWRYAVSDETLKLEEFAEDVEWSTSPLRLNITSTHLAHSIRDQRTSNGDIEQWAHWVMTNQPDKASEKARGLPDNSGIHITRSLHTAKQWANARRIGEERCGLIGSGQGRRLKADGIFVDEKADIVQWMLAPSGDVRSSNMLEQTQNQYQIQGLEVDYAIVCWDADLRRESGGWTCYNVSGADWVRSRNEEETTLRCNSYRVLLTRSRKGLIIFVPQGDMTGRDKTREPDFYNGIVEYLVQCGAHLL